MVQRNFDIVSRRLVVASKAVGFVFWLGEFRLKRWGMSNVNGNAVSGSRSRNIFGCFLRYVEKH